MKACALGLVRTTTLTTALTALMLAAILGMHALSAHSDDVWMRMMRWSD